MQLYKSPHAVHIFNPAKYWHLIVDRIRLFACEMK